MAEVCDIAYALLIERVESEVAALSHAAAANGVSPPDRDEFLTRLHAAVRGDSDAPSAERDVRIAIGLGR